VKTDELKEERRLFLTFPELVLCHVTGCCCPKEAVFEMFLKKPLVFLGGGRRFYTFFLTRHMLKWVKSPSPLLSSSCCRNISGSQIQTSAQISQRRCSSFTVRVGPRFVLRPLAAASGLGTPGLRFSTDTVAASVSS